MSERPFLSIGEVLDSLKEEFPDVTISKIRFLESQGLLDPERTPSGYRKFYEGDVARLRWILEQQREHFLPLKVIKERIANPEPEPAPSPLPVSPGSGGGAPVPTSRSTRVPGGGPAGSTTSLTLDELAAAAGLDATGVHELERYGLIAGRTVAGQLYYDEECLVVARLAAAMGMHGVEARHLRMYKTAAEREASTYEQIVLPLLKQRNPAARRRAAETLEELSEHGAGIRAAFLRAALRGITGA